MRIDIVMPQMGESVVEGTIVKWVKKDGDSVQKDETLLEISTDKVDSEIPSPAAGVLVEIVVQAGQKVAVGTVLARLETDVAEAKKAKEPAKAEPAKPAAKPAEAPKSEAPKHESHKPEPKQPEHKQPEPRQPAHAPARAAAPAPTSGSDEQGRRFYSPLVRAIARSEGVSDDELEQIQGSGLAGRVTKQDLVGYLANRKGGAQPAAAAPAPAVTPAPAPVHQPPAYQPPAPAPAAPPVSAHGVEVLQMDNMRRAIADHMVRSVHTSAHVTSVHEVDLSKIVRYREKHAAAFEKREGIKLTYTPFFVEAAIHGLRAHPWVNASVDGDKILVKKNINFGIAVALENGLIVPVIRNADGLNFVGLARAVNDLAARARSKKLTPGEVSDGTFTITNPGVFGTLIGTPIINQPQVGIMGVGAIKKRVVVTADDAIAVRPMMFLTLSYDHRIVDGMLAGKFLGTVQSYLENFDDTRSL